MRLRQIALIARDLEPVVADLCHVLGIEIGYRDPGIAEFGLHNAVMPVGDTFLEVVSPSRPDSAGARYLERHGGDWGYMVILQCDDLDRDRERVERLGVRVVWKMDLPDIRGTHLHPRDVGGAILSLDEAKPPESWRWAGPAWKEKMRTDVVTEITGVDIQGADPHTIARRWAEILDRQAEPVGEDHWRVRLDRGELDFVPARDQRGDGVCGFRVAATDGERLLANARARRLVVRDDGVEICGVRITAGSSRS